MATYAISIDSMNIHNLRKHASSTIFHIFLVKIRLICPYTLKRKSVNYLFCPGASIRQNMIQNTFVPKLLSGASRSFAYCTGYCLIH